MTIRVEQSGNVNPYSSGNPAGKVKGDESDIQLFNYSNTVGDDYLKIKQAHDNDEDLKYEPTPEEVARAEAEFKENLKTLKVDLELYATAFGCSAEELMQAFEINPAKLAELQKNPEELNAIISELQADENSGFAQTLNEYATVSLKRREAEDTLRREYAYNPFDEDANKLTPEAEADIANRNQEIQNYMKQEAYLYKDLINAVTNKRMLDAIMEQYK